MPPGARVHCLYYIGMLKNISEYEITAKEKLSEVKNRIQVFAMDYDGTLVDGKKYQRDDSILLFKLILENNKIPAFITARAATAVKIFIPFFKEYYRLYHSITPTYIGGGNGTILYKIDTKGVSQIYNHGLTPSDIKFIVSVWDEFAQQYLMPEALSEKGVATFQKFYMDDWAGLIPEPVLNIGKPYNGRIFTEEAKVTFVLPKDLSTHNRIVSETQKLVGEKFSVAAGDTDFCHITKSMPEDTKRMAVSTILELHGLNEDHVATFGDMPNGNDRGLLSFPNSFTNDITIIAKEKLKQPPFILPGAADGRVESVYNAVRFLLS